MVNITVYKLLRFWGYSLCLCQVEMKVCIMCEKGVRWHLVQGHAEGTDEAPIVVLQSNGGG